jgi:hypothetical protein
MALVSTADVAGSDATGVVTAARALERGEKGLLRLALGDLVKGREFLVAFGRSVGLESFKWHD